MIRALMVGLKTTLKEFFKKPITLQYPEERWSPPERYRGRLVLLTDDKGAPVCVACGLCEKICPCECITVVPETGAEGVRKLQEYTLDLTRCCFCGMCVESCPVEAIKMGPDYELAFYDKKDLVMGIDELKEK